MKSRLFNIRLSFEITENKSEGFFLLKNDLISLLDAIQRTGSIKAAAEELGYSFRHIWNELRRTRPVSSEPVSRKECRAFAFGRAAFVDQ